MQNVEHLEIHVAHACNLACENCSHYSDQGHKGVVSLEDAERWMAAWSGRVRLRTFSLVGGEPTIHPRLTDFVHLARRHWPDAFLRIVTNGFYLHKHPELPAVLGADPKTHLYFSIHHTSPEYLDKVRANYELLRRWMRELGVRAFFYHSYAHWRRIYHGTGAAMEPYADGQPRKSWERCNAKGCPQLFESRIWKCSPLAYLGMQHAKVGLSDKWKPYLAYQPLTPECTDDELSAFFAKEEEPYCSMCPAQPAWLKISTPLKLARTAELQRQ